MSATGKQKTEKIVIGQIALDGTEEGITQAVERADELIGILSLGEKDAMHVRLLFEEALGLLKALTGVFDAQVHFERDADECRVIVDAKTKMDITKKTDLIAVSTSGKNASAKGFMGKIADIIETGFLGYDDVMMLQETYNAGRITYGGLGMYQPASGMAPEIIWSLNNYKEGLNEAIDEDGDAAKEAWDELEKSIVASIAKDVIVGVKKDTVKLTLVYDVKGK